MADAAIRTIATFPLATSGFLDSSTFKAYQPPPHITDLTEDDECVLSGLEEDWSCHHGPIAPDNDDLAGKEEDGDGHAAISSHRGLTMDELTDLIAEDVPAVTGAGDYSGIPDRPTLTALMVAAGYLTRIPEDRRYVLSKSAVNGKVGRNVRPKRGYPFPIVFPESVAEVLCSLGWTELKACVASLSTVKERTGFLARHYRHLPVDTLVKLSGSSKRTMERALAKHRR